MPSRPCDLRATSSSGPDRPLQSSPTSMIAQVSALMTRTRTAIAVAASSGLPPPPLQTTRLGIKVGGPDSYEVGVAALAKATGQRPASPPAAVKRYESESSLESGMGTEGGSEMKGRKKKKKILESEYYDLPDPFIDDSKLEVDERTFIAQTKQQGFAKGLVESAERGCPRKAESLNGKKNGAS